MTMMTISSDDPRSLKAVEIAAGAAGWQRCHTDDGVCAYRIPSQADAEDWYVVTASSCTCADFVRHGLVVDADEDLTGAGPCKHILAVRLHRALLEGAHWLRSR